METIEKLPMSDFPEESSNWEEWEPSDRVCPKCENVRMWEIPEYDDPSEMGGAHIGTMYDCGNCNYYETK